MAELDRWFNIKTAVRGFFTDENALGLDKAEKRALEAVGRQIRFEARDLLVRRKGPAAAGEVPHVHSRDKRYTLRFILYFYDRSAGSLVVGPVGLTRTGSIPTPQLLEQGGSVTRDEVQFPGADDWTPLAIFKRPTAAMDSWPHRRRTYKVEPRPFMVRALDAALPRIPDEFAATLWGGS